MVNGSKPIRPEGITMQIDDSAIELEPIEAFTLKVSGMDNGQ